MNYNNATSKTFNYTFIQLDKDVLNDSIYSDTNIFEDSAYSNPNVDIHKNETKRFRSVYDGDIAQRFKNMQNNIYE